MMKRIAIIKLSAMGDIIHAMVALQYIKRKYPNLQIDWFVESTFAPILENNPDINEIIKLDLKSIKKDKKEILNQIKLIKKYEKNFYDLVIDAQGLIKSAIVSFFLGKNRVGFSKNSTREKLASFFYTKKVDIAYDKNAIERNVKVLSQALNFEITKDDILNKKPFLFYKNENEVIYEYLSKDKKNVLFVIGASWPSKMYSKEKFAKIINNLDLFVFNKSIIFSLLDCFSTGFNASLIFAISSFFNVGIFHTKISSVKRNVSGMSYIKST